MERIGMIFYAKNLTKEEKIFLKVARKKKVKLIFFNVAKEIDDCEIERKIKECDIIFNNSAENIAIEIIKTAEAMDKKVIDSSKCYHYSEDKWLFYLNCKKRGLPVVKTTLLSWNVNIIKKELKKFNHWPVILKRIEGCCGQYVDKADNMESAVKIVKKFWKKGTERLPIIAQEMINSPSFRVTLIDGKIVQTAIKDNKSSWKSTGVYTKDGNFEKFAIERNLKKILNEVVKMSKIKICGIDLLKKDGKWLLLEINATPGLDFFEDEREMLASKIMDFLIKEIKKK